jgi:hypothetical protein
MAQTLNELVEQFKLTDDQSRGSIVPSETRSPLQPVRKNHRNEQLFESKKQPVPAR